MCHKASKARGDVSAVQRQYKLQRGVSNGCKRLSRESQSDVLSTWFGTGFGGLKSSLPYQPFSRLFSILRSFRGSRLSAPFRYIRYNESDDGNSKPIAYSAPFCFGNAALCFSMSYRSSIEFPRDPTTNREGPSGGERFTWRSANLQPAGDIRRRYIEALHAADNHDYEPLLEFARS